MGLMVYAAVDESGKKDLMDASCKRIVPGLREHFYAGKDYRLKEMWL